MSLIDAIGAATAAGKSFILYVRRPRRNSVLVVEKRQGQEQDLIRELAAS